MSIRIKGFDGVDIRIEEGYMHITPNRPLDMATKEELIEWKEYYDPVILPEERGAKPRQVRNKRPKVAEE